MYLICYLNLLLYFKNILSKTVFFVMNLRQYEIIVFFEKLTLNPLTGPWVAITIYKALGNFVILRPYIYGIQPTSKKYQNEKLIGRAIILNDIEHMNASWKTLKRVGP